VKKLVEAQAEINGGGDAAKKLKQLRAQEKQLLTSTCIKIVHGKLGDSGVLSVSYCLEDGLIIETTDWYSIEQCFIKANEAKLHHAQDTHFMVEPMASEVGWLGIGPKVCQMLGGTYEPPEGVDDATRLLIEQFCRNYKARTYAKPCKITTEEWQGFWRVAKENASCASKLLHFGVWKAVAFSDLISELDAILTDIPLQTGYPPKRWRQAVDAMLKEKEGVTLIDFVRTIVLFHADFNYLNKFVGREMMWNAELFGQLAAEQFGSRAG
jgi:hypothetical protein